MLGSGANANLEALGGSETDYLAVGEYYIVVVPCQDSRYRHNGTNTFSIGSGPTGAFSDSTPRCWAGVHMFST